MKNAYHPLVASLAVVVCHQLATCNSHAALGFVSDRSSVSPNQTIDWSDFGLEFDILDSPFSGQTSVGLGFTASLPGSGKTLSLLDQSSGWDGNFADGETVLTTDFYPEPLTLKFDEPIQGLAFQIQSDFFGDFTGVIEAFDDIGNSLGSFPFAGFSDTAADDSAVTIGLLSDASDIDHVTFSLETGFLDTYAINHVSISGPIPPAPPTEVPEVGTMASAGLLAGLTALWLRRQRTSHTQA